MRLRASAKSRRARLRTPSWCGLVSPFLLSASLLLALIQLGISLWSCTFLVPCCVQAAQLRSANMTIADLRRLLQDASEHKAMSDMMGIHCAELNQKLRSQQERTRELESMLEAAQKVRRASAAYR